MPTIFTKLKFIGIQRDFPKLTTYSSVWFVQTEEPLQCANPKQQKQDQVSMPDDIQTKLCNMNDKRELYYK